MVQKRKKTTGRAIPKHTTVRHIPPTAAAAKAPPVPAPVPAQVRSPRPASITGSCACGAVRFTVNAHLRDVWICHCAKCRRWHGHAGAYTNAPTSAVVFTQTRGLSWWQVSAKAQRGFCFECGSSLFWRGLEENTIALCAGSLDGPTGLLTEGHMFVSAKGDYYSIPEDGAPRHSAFPPTMTMN